MSLHWNLSGAHEFERFCSFMFAKHELDQFLCFAGYGSYDLLLYCYKRSAVWGLPGAPEE